MVKENLLTGGSIFVEKRNHCVIYPANGSMVAQSVERRNKNWFVQTKIPSDLIVQIKDKSFHLHKLSMVSRSGYISRLVFHRNGDNITTIQIDAIPGGANIFELIVKFCYGLKIKATASNVAPLYCAAHFLEMHDDLQPGNLISKTEAFLSYVILSSWKDTFRILKSCESVSSWSKDLHIVKRCSEAISWKACSETSASSIEDNEVLVNVMTDDTTKLNVKKLSGNWFFKDVASLRIDHFIEVITSIKKRNIKPELIGSCIAHWTKKWISQITVSKQKSKDQELSIQLHRVTTECLIRVLPVEENSVPCNFLLHLFKIGLIMNIDPRLQDQLKTRVAFLLESCSTKDLLVRNSTTLFDVDIVVQVVEAYVSLASNKPNSKMSVVGRLVDDYLALVSRDENLVARCFYSLVNALPKEARSCDDNLYRSIDMYLKEHPDLTEEERSSICRKLEYHKLSQEARTHAMKNDRLPDNIRTQFILVEQINMTRLLTSAGSSYQRTKSQTIMKVSKGVGKSWMNSSQNEMEMMKQEVEMLNAQVGELKQCRMELQRQTKKSVFC
ncbi:root phototropism protein 3-like [Nicotiana sylvestris]|uniref:Root phototropism protein 3-like n=1 Tax=Nicotiana sylvestris TaxID=4096 RepID=A0A1U7W425_NICSY|nr:PREDICTED: root phototropism protein 3-like [Nicotiana sylvestris]